MRKKILLLLALLIFSGSAVRIFVFGTANKNYRDFSSYEKQVKIVDGKNVFFLYSKEAMTVGEFLAASNIGLKNEDFIFPGHDSKLYPGGVITIMRSKNIFIEVDGISIESKTILDTVDNAIAENKIEIRDEDIVYPGRNKLILDKQEIKITRVIIKEEVKNEPVAFKEIEREDDKLGWRIKKITQKGEKGNMEVKYKVAYHDGKEVSRKIIGKEKTKDSIDQIVTQGTYMKLGKAREGQGTWYTFKGGMFAASTILPRGSFAKVTSLASGKSVVVQINDYGPFGKGRIIDLDKVAFQKLAPLGAGVIGVKVEQVLN